MTIKYFEGSAQEALVEYKAQFQELFHQELSPENLVDAWKLFEQYLANLAKLTPLGQSGYVNKYMP